MEQIIIGNIRVQILRNDIVRIEYGKCGKFCDAGTFYIPDRHKFSDTQVAYTREENVVCFGEYELYIPENAKSLAGVRLDKNGKNVYTYKKLKNNGELPKLDKTPEVFAIADTPRIIVPIGGYSADRNGEYIVRENVQDIYILLCRKDAKKLRKLYTELTGKCELVRLSTLGGWNSKYYAYTQDEAKQLILDYEKHDIPLDVMVIDTDWRSCENGWGYDINTALFPDMKGFLDFAHAHGVEVCFNDHPEPVEGSNVFAPQEIAYREKNLQSLMQNGLDIWWYDRNWNTHLISPSKNVYWETLGLYLFADITANHYRKQTSDGKPYRRPVVMGNVVNVVNGSYQKICDSASHRYPIQWTGDISSDYSALAQEVSTLIKAGDSCISYCNADCGGHTGNPSEDEFIRWMQFGTLSPVFRPHCTKNVLRTREPWVFGKETENIVREYNNLRYRLLPIIYKNAYNNYETGEPIFKSLGWEYSNDKRAVSCDCEYMLGNNILIMPVVGDCPEIVDGKSFVTPVDAVYYDGMELKGEPIAKATYKKLEMNLNHVSPEKGVPVYYFSARFSAKVKFETAGQLYIKCDDGATVWIDDEKVLEDKTLHSAVLFPLKKLEAGREYNVKIEYFQAGGEAYCALLYKNEANPDAKSETYLPSGKWLDVFDGHIYAGNTVVKKQYGLKEMPLFVRAGALLPLAYDAKNTKAQRWNKMVYDFYPDKDFSDEGYLYEDDTATVAYKCGEYRKSAYSAGYCKKCNAYFVRFKKAEGQFCGDKNFEKREIKIKAHLLGGENIKRVTVNGAETAFKTVKKDANVFPMNTGDSACDADTVVVVLDVDLRGEYEIKFCL